MNWAVVATVGRVVVLWWLYVVDGLVLWEVEIVVVDEGDGYVHILAAGCWNVSVYAWRSFSLNSSAIIHPTWHVFLWWVVCSGCGWSLREASRQGMQRAVAAYWWNIKRASSAS